MNDSEIERQASWCSMNAAVFVVMLSVVLTLQLTFGFSLIGAAALIVLAIGVRAMLLHRSVALYCRDARASREGAIARLETSRTTAGRTKP